MSKPKAVFNWSGGKDSALALQKVLEEQQFEVIALLTTVTEKTLKSSIHGIPVSLLQKQAESIGIPLFPVLLTESLSTYNDNMLEAVNYFKEKEVAHFIFGDIFLEDVLAYRRKMLDPVGIKIIEPLWNIPSTEVMNEFLSSRLKSKIIVTQASVLDQSFVGRELNPEAINDFPDNVDICGENGEYHSFTYDGKIFKYPVEFSIKEVKKIVHDIKLDNGVTESFEYWQAEFED